MTQNPNQKIRVLAVSREASVLSLLQSLEASHHWRLETAASGWDAMEAVQSGALPGLLVLDIVGGDADSLHFLRWLRRTDRRLPVVLLCYAEEAEQGRESLQLGAGEILVRPFESKQLEGAIRRQLGSATNGHVDTEIEAMMNGKNTQEIGQDGLLASSSLITQKLRTQAALMAKTDVPVLIVGEPGAGKFAVATLVHSLSVRSGFQLRRLHCAEMPESLLEAELFGGGGREVESRTGFGKSGAGRKDTIFLDEITALPPVLQTRLAHLLEKDEFRSAGAEAPSANIRILAASSANLDRAVAEKRLREDLYYRISAFTVQVPPLRQRKDEIALLLCHFMHKLAQYYTLPTRGFSAAVVGACQGYSWPGNLKEMETFVKRYLVAGDEESALQEIGLGSDGLAASGIVDHTVPRAQRWFSAPVLPRPMTQKDAQPESLKSLIQGVKSEAEQSAIGAALLRTGWNRKAAARLLRVSYRTLLYKIDQYHMRAPEPYFPALPVKEFSEFEEVKGNGKAS